MRLFKELYQYRELISVLVWKNVIVRYKQAYLGIAWAIFRPALMTLVFMVVRSFVGIDTGEIPYSILTFTALMPWIFFQETTTDGITSVVANANLVRKIYFPREVLPLTSVFTKLIELGINFVILILMMLYYRISPTLACFWAPVIILYVMLAALCVNLAGSAIYVYYRDVGAALPVLLSFLMYTSPVIYPLSLVEKHLLTDKAMGNWSEALFTMYNLNPMVGIIDSLQRVLLMGKSPDLNVLLPGLIFTVLLLPVSHYIFKRAEIYFVDVI